ncbi:MAG: DUF433 domain-containing protein [Thermodesulfobacteriota bacterium]
MGKITDIRYLPYYSVSEAAMYLGVAKSTIRAWLGRQSNFECIITPAQESPLSLSFINLIELYVLISIRRKHKISMNKVRTGLEYIKNKFPSEHPLANKKFETDGINLFLEKTGKLYNITQDGQTEMISVIQQYLKRIEHDEEGNPIRFYPMSRKGNLDQPKLILIDPNVSFGRPTVSDKAIPIDIIYERWTAGESIAELAIDYECTQEEIEEALRIPITQQAA